MCCIRWDTLHNRGDTQCTQYTLYNALANLNLKAVLVAPLCVSNRQRMIFARAEAYYRVALNHNPLYAEGQYNLGAMLLQSGRFKSRFVCLQSSLLFML
jgi:hypothetical protein